MIYTVGYRQFEGTQDLLDVVDFLGAARVLDCRANPRTPNCWHGARLAEILGERYTWAGDRLGGRGHVTADGLRLAEELAAAPEVTILLCACKAPGDCHLHHDVARHLRAEVRHIYYDQVITCRELERMISLRVDATDPGAFAWMPLEQCEAEGVTA